MKRTADPRAGFALIMIVVVIGALFIAAGIALPEITSRIDNRTSDDTRDRMDELEQAMRAYARDGLRVPARLSHLVTSDGRSSWRGPYHLTIVQGWAGQAADLAKDNWSRAYRWRRTSTSRGTLTSAGPNGEFGDADDIERTISIFDILQELTLHRLAVVNTAIKSYNDRFGRTWPLYGNATTIVRRLRLRGFLPRSTVYDRDAFGTSFQVVGRPARSFRSIHLGR